MSSVDASNAVLPGCLGAGHTFPSWDRANVLAGNSTLLTKCSMFDQDGGYGPSMLAHPVGLAQCSALLCTSRAEERMIRP